MTPTIWIVLDLAMAVAWASLAACRIKVGDRRAAALRALVAGWFVFMAWLWWTS